MDATEESVDQAPQWLERIAGGSEQAMADFYKAFESRVYAFALTRLNDPHAAADIVNEVMMAVWQGAHRFQGNAKVSTWLLSITQNKVVDTMRKRKMSQQDELDEDLPDTEAQGTADMIANAQDAERLRECMARLSGQQHEVVHLAFFEDLTYGEIASIVGCPEGTVKTRMFHAKGNLKRCLRRLLK